MSELEKTLLEAPTLPNHIQGDGRYLMSLLKSFLEQTAEQINLANGFSAEEINPSAGAYPTPRNFFLTFNRLGGTLSWTHLSDVSNLAYYELRTDTNVGVSYNLLERTLDNSSMVLPANYVGQIYLYAVSKDKVASNPSTISYSKPRPDAPTDIALTKNNEGTLITFLEIPTNCIGANIYVDGVKYQSVDNIYLFTEERAIKKVEIAYYDQFGEGERGVLYLVLPDVDGFLVERNGSELDFYWEPVPVYGVSYIVKVCVVPDWDKAIELFTTKTNDKNRFIYPNTGQYYLLVKAQDQHGSFSKNAAYQLIDTDVDYHRNVILSLKQNDTAYKGSKINLYYQPSIGGVTLERDALNGEYVADVTLPQKYKARNWIEFNALSVSGDDTAWVDGDFPWLEATGNAWAGVTGDMNSTTIKQQIATYTGASEDTAFLARLNRTTEADSGGVVEDEANADTYKDGRWTAGLEIGDLTRLEYSLDKIRTTYSLLFNLKVTEELPDCILVVLANDDEWLTLGYKKSSNEFYLVDCYGQEIRTPAFKGGRDWLSFGISQGKFKRSLYAFSFGENKYSTNEAEYVPMKAFTKLYCYPKIFFNNNEE